MENKSRKRNQYINNKTLYTNLIHYKNTLKNARELGQEPPQVTRYIGEAIVMINTNLALRPNFSGYTYKQEMISDGIVDCLAAVDNFNPEKTNNPFAYFTQIAWNAFIRRISKEKKQQYIKHKNMQSLYLDYGMDTENNEFSNQIIEDYEKKNLTNTKKSSKLSGVEKFME